MARRKQLFGCQVSLTQGRSHCVANATRCYFRVANATHFYFRVANATRCYFRVANATPATVIAMPSICIGHSCSPNNAQASNAVAAGTR